VYGKTGQAYVRRPYAGFFICTLKNSRQAAHSSPPEIIQVLRIVCHDAFAERTSRELKSACKYAPESPGAGNAPAWECLNLKERVDIHDL